MERVSTSQLGPRSGRWSRSEFTLVTETPKLDVVRLVPTGMLSPQVSPAVKCMTDLSVQAVRCKAAPDLLGVSSPVAVLEQAERFLESTGTHVQAQVAMSHRPSRQYELPWTFFQLEPPALYSRFDLESSSIVDEFVQTEMVGFLGQPGELDTLRSVGDGSDTVLPVPVGYVVSFLVAI